MDDDHIRKHGLNKGFDRFIARLERAVEHRDSLEQYCKHESAVVVDYVAHENFVSVMVKQAEPVPSRASTVLSDWLHQVRASLDGAFYTLAALETGSYPPSRPRTRTFPIRATATEFEQMLASDSNPTRGMSASTVERIERSQPYHGKYGADGDSLLWIHNMSRIDRHRHSFELALRVVPDGDTGLNFDSRSPRPVTIRSGPENVTLTVESGMLFAEIEYESDSDAARVVRERWVKPRFMFGLEASEWYADAVARDVSKNIRNDSLTTRMRFCEWFVAALVKTLSDQVTTEQIYIPDWVNVG
ncbi:hypothetical protein HQP04_10665 [Rhodococcus fascians]|nr:hypothetical protein [Rhodococcus fascians]MBY4022485.1 hypothetical protein [Rhodococcus fascians]